LSSLVKEDDHTKGAMNAPVTLVEYGDYECPYTGRAYPIVKEIQKRLGDRLLFVFRNFPLTQIHPHAQHAAEAAEAAAIQGKFWEMHDYLFEHQQALDDDHLARYASKLALDVNRFNQDMSKHSYAARIHQDMLSGERSGVEGTPTFFINGVRYDESWDLKTLLGAIKNAM
jgi:protein-disulfide isomerase